MPSERIARLVVQGAAYVVALVITGLAMYACMVAMMCG